MRYQSKPGRKRIEGPKGGRSTCILTVLQCEYHGQYSGHIVAMTRQPVHPCPQCISDRDWYTSAALALRQEIGGRPTHDQVLARAEQMAGHELRRFRHG